MLGGAEYVSLDALKSGQEKFASIYNDNPVLTVGIFALAYIAITALSLPGAAVSVAEMAGTFEADGRLKTSITPHPSSSYT